MQTNAARQLTIAPTFAPTTRPAAGKSGAASRARLLRAMAHRADLIAVACLMLSSGAYGLFALLFLTH